MIKKSIYVLFATIIIGGLFFTSCDKEDVSGPEKSGKLVFSLNQLPAETGGVSLKSAEAKEDAVAIIVTIIGSLGDTLYYQEELELYNFNGSFLTEAILLPEGNYELTEFLVLDDEHNVIYTTPQEGSNYAYLVSDPLGLSFEVLVDKITKVVPEVITTDCICTAIDFGYVGFDFKVVDVFCILLNTQMYDVNQKNHVFVSADITVEGDGEVIYTGNIPARTDSLKLPDGYQEYKFIFSKAGSGDPIDTTMTNDEIKAFIDSPLEIKWPWLFMFDVEGNLYPVVQMGDQMWMARNLVARTRRDGSTQPDPTPRWLSPDYLDYRNNPDWDTGLRAGLLYKTAAAYVPEGWHIPSDEEWMELELFLGMDPAAVELSGMRGTNEGGMLRNGAFKALLVGKGHWEDIRNAPPGNVWYTLTFEDLGSSAYFMTSTQSNQNYYAGCWYRALSNTGGIIRSSDPTRYEDYYYSVRCVKD